MNNYIDFTSNSPGEIRSTVHLTKLGVPYCRTQCAKLSYLKRIIAMWNSIPSAIYLFIYLLSQNHQNKIHKIYNNKTFKNIKYTII